MVDFASLGSFFSGAGALGGLFGGGGLSARKAAALEAKYNREVMQNSLQWRAEDAEKAGISKHFAMGAPAVSFSPSVAGGNDSSVSRISEAGQSIGRAANAFADSKMRRVLFEQEVRMNELKIKDAEVALQKSASDLAISTSGGTVPINSNAVNLMPSKSVTNIAGNRGIEAGVPPGVKAYVMPDGHTMMLPSVEAAEAMEGNLLYGIEHYLRNRVVSPIVWGARKMISRPARRRGSRFYND